MTLQESLQAEITSLETALSAKKAAFETLVTASSTWLTKDVEEIKTEVVSVWSHLFGSSTVPTPVPPAAPAAPTMP